MSRLAVRSARSVRALVAGSVGALLVSTVVALGAAGPAAAAGGVQASATAAKKSVILTPGNFTGFGFDQCLTPSQTAMDRWLQTSPFLAVGIYISGDSRGCRYQPNLTPQWVRTQLSKGWRLLPLTVGPQASCQPRFPRYGNDRRITSRPGRNAWYPKARSEGRAEAAKSVGAAKALGIAPGSTLWYDLEGFDLGNTRCRESALAFLSGWSTKIRDLGFVSGVYSSAGSGIVALDNARVNRPGVYAMPDQIWVARWDGQANTSTTYLRGDAWRPHARIKQYRGGHNETWGGVTINIDSNFLDVGRGSVAAPETHCGGVQIAWGVYERLLPPTNRAVPPPRKVKALQCLLQEKGVYRGAINGRYAARTQAAAKAWQAAHGITVRATWTTAAWMSLLSAGSQPVAKFGSAGPAVRRLQRTLNASGVLGSPLRATGVFNAATTTALKTWQAKAKVQVSGVAGTQTWAALSAGKR